MMEYKIENKVKSIVDHYKGKKLNNIQLHTGCGQVAHINKEYEYIGWHRPVVSIGLASAENPQKVIFKASFDSKDKLNMLIKLLENQRNAFD